MQQYFIKGEIGSIEISGGKLFTKRQLPSKVVVLEYYHSICIPNTSDPRGCHYAVTTFIKWYEEVQSKNGGKRDR